MNLAFSLRTAQEYIRLFENRHLLNGCQSVRQAVKRVRKVKVQEDRRKQKEEGEKLASPNWCQLHHADFRKLPDIMGPLKADCLLADPPWDEANNFQYEAIADTALKILNDAGFLLVWYSRLVLPQVLHAFRQFTFIDQLFTVYDTFTPHWRCGLRYGTRPVLLFSKGEPGKMNGMLLDTVRSSPMKPAKKQHHEWQQCQESAEFWLSRLTWPGNLIADCHIGGGTFAAAVQAIGGGRRYIGTDLDERALAVAKTRLAGN